MRVALAVTLETDVFLAVHRVVAWAIWGGGVLLLLGRAPAATRGA